MADEQMYMSIFPQHDTDDATYCDRDGCSCGLPSSYRWFAGLEGTYRNSDPLSKWCGVHWNQFVNGKPKFGEHAAFVLWKSSNGPYEWYLCKEALDNWLDNADDDPSLEPRELVFL